MKQDILTIRKAVLLSHRPISKEGRERRREKAYEKLAKGWSVFLKWWQAIEDGKRKQQIQRKKDRLRFNSPRYGSRNKSIPENYNAAETARQRRERTGVR